VSCACRAVAAGNTSRQQKKGIVGCDHQIAGRYQTNSRTGNTALYTGHDRLTECAHHRDHAIAQSYGLIGQRGALRWRLCRKISQHVQITASHEVLAVTANQYAAYSRIFPRRQQKLGDRHQPGSIQRVGPIRTIEGNGGNSPIVFQQQRFSHSQLSTSARLTGPKPTAWQDDSLAHFIPAS
jgi:hypothetical protein